MVSSSKSERSEAKRDEKLSRRARKSSLYLRSVQSEARLAAQHAAQRAAGAIDASGDDASVGSESSTRSTERAVKRGSRRALVDSFGDNNTADHRASNDASSFGLTTITEEEGTTRTDDSRKKKKKWKGLKGKSRDKKQNRNRIVSFGSQESASKVANTSDAWMCGCCGKVFATYKSAETHEEKCVRDNAAKAGLMKAAPKEKNSSPPRAMSDLDLFADAASEESWEKESVDGEGEDHRKNVEFASAVQEGSPSHTPDQKIAPSTAAQSILRHNDSPAVSRSWTSASGQNVTQMTGPRRPSLLQTSVIPEFRELGEDVLLPGAMRKYVVLNDEALVNVVLRSAPMTLSPSELDAELELKLLAGDKLYYDAMSERAEHRKKYRGFTRSEGTGILSKVQNKFVDAYQLIKEGDGDEVMGGDQYVSKKKGSGSGGQDIAHTDGTIYVNVIVKNSVRVVDNELERLAQQRWEDLKDSTIIKDEKSAQFERFRKFAHAHAVKLAGLALQSDFTPRRIAVQLSNDLYRLMVPRLKRRGVTIETEIEYRVGAYFVLAANVKTIDWVKLMKYSKRDKEARQKKWKEEQVRRDKLREGTAEEGKADDIDDSGASKVSRIVLFFQRMRAITMFEVIANCLAWLDCLPLIISVPFCWIMYHCFMKATVKIFILSTAADRKYLDMLQYQTMARAPSTHDYCDRQESLLTSRKRAWR